MKRIVLTLLLLGFVSIGAGIATPFVGSALTQSQVIHCSGCIVYHGGESTPAENSSRMPVDIISLSSIIFGVGFLSSGFLYAKVQKNSNQQNT